MFSHQQNSCFPTVIEVRYDPDGTLHISSYGRLTVLPFCDPYKRIENKTLQIA